MVVLDDKQQLRRRQPPIGVSHGVVTDGFELPTIEANDLPPAAYGGRLDAMQFTQPGFEAGAVITDDGRVDINILTKNRRLAEFLAPTLHSQAVDAERPPLPPAYIPPSLGGQPGQTPPPHLNVVIQIVGSRGDVQPFVALGKILKDTYGHRVRIATHTTFQAFVEDNGLEFFSIGGDPAELMAFMVKHPGLMPGLDAITSGEIRKRRQGIQEMLFGCWRSCIEAGNGLGPPPTPHGKNDPVNPTMQLPGGPNNEPFVADAIIANPPSFAHIHVAERLGIPLHMMFTMPWSPTRAFPHPLANVKSSNTDDVMTNYLTYTLVEMMTWQGLGDIINRFREKALDLEPLSFLGAPGLLARLKIPWTYCWSPALIPKPNDWGPDIDISGFYFLNLASSFTPNPDLAAFLESGSPPVYIGFGSIVVDDPNAMTQMIFDAIRLSGVRALVSKGWGGLGADDVGVPEGVFMLGNVPHDWLFERVLCVVHHGGAGTTAAGIKAGRPTLIVPFFGDQPFWGSMVSRAKAGPDPISYKELTAEKLADAIKYCLQPDTLDRATEMGQKIREEKGTDTGGQSFHSHLQVDKLRCSIAPSRAAAWRVQKTQTRLSPLAAAVLVDKGLIQYSDLKLYRPVEYNTEDQPPDPITAGAMSLVTDLGGIGMAIADMPREVFRSKPKTKTKMAAEERSPDTQSTPSGAPQSNVSSTLLASPNTTSAAQDASRRSTDSKLSTSSTEESQGGILTPTDSVSHTTTSEAKSPSAKQKQQESSQAGLRAKTNPLDAPSFGMDAAVGTGRSVGRIVTTGVRTPMNFCLGLAKGFRNIPKMYNDDTIRPTEKVTDLSSGIRIASKEFGYGFFDGIAGLVTQPLRGAEKEGAQGLVKGIGKGIGGLISKPAAGIWGIPAYTMQGVHAEINKYFAKSVTNYIITSRAVQGERDMSLASNEEREDILKRWDNSKDSLKDFYSSKKKGKVAGKQPVKQDRGAENNSPAALSNRAAWLQGKISTFEEKKRTRAKQGSSEQGGTDAAAPSPMYNGGGQTSLLPQTLEDAEFEAAIQASVRETSHGNAEEDATIEVAMRKSVKAMRQRATEGRLVPEIPPTVREKNPNLFEDKDYQITDEEYQALIEQATQQSLIGHMSLPQASRATGSDMHYAGEYPTQASSNDEVFKRVLEESRASAVSPQYTDEDTEFERAIAASKEAMESEESQRTEEDIVMEYVKKQSLAEDEYRKKKLANEGEGAGSQDEGEDLKRAIEESLSLHAGNQAGTSGAQ